LDTTLAYTNHQKVQKYAFRGALTTFRGAQMHYNYHLESLTSANFNAYLDEYETSHMTFIIIGVPFLLHVQSFCKASVLLWCMRARLTVIAAPPLFYFTSTNKVRNEICNKNHGRSASHTFLSVTPSRPMKSIILMLLMLYHNQFRFFLGSLVEHNCENATTK